MISTSVEESFILVVWPEYPPRTGGMQVHGFQFACFLRDRGYKFAVVTNEPTTSEEAAESQEFDARHGIFPLRILRRSNFAHSLATLRSCVRALRPHGIFCSQLGFSPALVGAKRVICRSAGNDILRPWVGPHDITYKAMRRIEFEEQRQRLTENRRWVIEAARYCHSVACNSEWTQRKLSELGIENIDVIRGGVDINIFHPMDKSIVRQELDLSPRGQYLLCVGRHVVKKGFDTAIEAFSRLPNNKCELIFIGQGPETNNLRGLADELGVLSRIRFIGTLPHEVVPRFFSAADIVLAPSRTVYDPRRFAVDYETMCRVVCEAAACRKAVIASNVCGIPSVVKHEETGVLVPPNDPCVLAQEISRVMNDSELLQRLEKGGFQWATSELSFEQVNASVLERLLEQHNG